MSRRAPQPAFSPLAAAAALAVLAFGCEQAAPGPGTWVGLLGGGDIIPRIDHFRVWVFDSAAQRCDGASVPDPRAPALASTGDVVPSGTTRIDVPAGERTFYAEAYGSPGDGDVIATGCAEQALAQGEHATVLIRLAETGVDGGDGDGDGDGGADGEDDTADSFDEDGERPDVEEIADEVEDIDAPDEGVETLDEGVEALDEGGDAAEAADEATADGDGGPSVYYTSTFDPAGCAGWRTAALLGANDWQCRSAPGDPEGGHDPGGGVLATVVSGDYSLRSDCYAESPPIDASGGSGPLRLGFWHWMESEAFVTSCTGTFANDDGGMVELSVGGGPFTNAGVTPYGGYPFISLDAFFTGGPAHVDGLPGFACRSGDPRPPAPEVAWERECFNVTAFRNSNLRIRFYFGSGAFEVARGWYVDEVVVEDGSCP